MPNTKETDVYKDFAQRLRRFTLQNAYIIISDEDATEQLKKYIRLLTKIKFEEENYHTYYGAIKKIVYSFINYYSSVIDRVIISADKYANVVDRNEILYLMDKTISVHVDRQISFGKDYLPVQSAEERQNYDEIQEMYDAFMLKLYELKQQIEKLDKQEKTEAFAKEHFKYALDKSNEIFDFAHVYMAMFLIEKLREIRISLEEILLRLKNNLHKIEEESELALNTLMHNLYDQNKELMTVSRQYRMNSVEIAEINRTIEKTRDQLDVYKYDATRARLDEEVQYWENKLNDFNEIDELLKKLLSEQSDVEKQREIYASRTCTEYPGTKSNCWVQMGKNFDERSKILREKIVEAGKALVTFFGIRGADRIFYESDLGKYYVDEYNHQIYVEDYGLGTYHVNCQGEFRQVSDKPKYLFDEYGRYIHENGEKIYQVAGCTSKFKLDEDDLLKKITKDCGHSEAVNRKCKMRIKDPNDVEVLPDVDLVDIKGTLDPEVITYLWETFGHILPQALHDVGHDHSKNPIHNLAHKLLHYKHEKTRTELNIMKKEATEFRANIYKDRQNKAAGEAKAWKAKQVKRRKPEESDDTAERAVYDAKVADERFVESLNYFYS